jgi:hypothetical protein
MQEIFPISQETGFISCEIIFHLSIDDFHLSVNDFYFVRDNFHLSVNDFYLVRDGFYS